MTRMIKIAVLSTAVAIIAATSNAQSALSLNDIRAAVDSSGYEIVSTAETGIFIEIGGNKVYISVAGFDGDITYVHWHPTLGDHIQPDAINVFNRDIKFGRIYRDADGDIVLQMDRNVTGGATEANVASDLEVMEMLLDKLNTDNPRSN